MTLPQWRESQYFAKGEVEEVLNLMAECKESIACSIKHRSVIVVLEDMTEGQLQYYEFSAS